MILEFIDEDTFPPDPDTEEIIVDKLSCARSQIDTAIALYFDGGDPVSIHTLVAAATEILKQLNTHRGGAPLWLEFAFLDKPKTANLRKRAINQLRSFQNFFKHADKDPNETKAISPLLNEFWLLNATDVFGGFAEKTPAMKIFQVWGYSLNFDIFSVDERGKFPDEFLQLMLKIRTKYSRASKYRYFTKMLKDMEP
jgi:hypothetical protein